MLYLIAVLVVVAGFWFILFFYFQDLKLPLRKVNGIKKLLVVFPHPDDEVLTCGGLMKQVHLNGGLVTYAVLTKGECGTEDAHYEESLKQVRSMEMLAVKEIFCIERLLHEDFGDGQLAQRYEQLYEYLDRLFYEESPEVVVTYDLSGLYGHQDHIVVSEIITELVTVKYTNIRLWYATFPARIMALAKLPEHMAKDAGFIGRRVLPTFRIDTCNYIWEKVRALYTHKSQLRSFKKSVPYGLPVWFVYSSWANECFYEVIPV